MTPPSSPPTIRRLLALLCLTLAATDADVPAVIHWAITTRPLLWEPLALAALGTLWFDLTYQHARTEALD